MSKQESLSTVRPSGQSELCFKRSLRKSGEPGDPATGLELQERKGPFQNATAEQRLQSYPLFMGSARK